MEQASEKLQRLAEAEWLRARIEARRMAARALWSAIAIAVGFVMLLALSAALFLALIAPFGAPYAALATGGALALLALGAFAMGQRSTNRREQLEAEIATRAVNDAREALRTDIAALETRINEMSDGLTRLLKAGTPGETKGLDDILATLTMVLKLAGAASPTLERYVRPILKIIG